MHKWTPEELARLKELYQNHTRKECAAIMGFEVGQVVGAVKNHHITCGRDTRFPKGYVP